MCLWQIITPSRALTLMYISSNYEWTCTDQYWKNSAIHYNYYLIYIENSIIKRLYFKAVYIHKKIAIHTLLLIILVIFMIIFDMTIKFLQI